MTGSNSLVYPQQPPPIPVTTSTILPTVIQTPYSPVMTNSMIPMYTTISPPPVTVFSSVYPQPVQPVPIDPYSSTHRQFYLSQPSFI